MKDLLHLSLPFRIRRPLATLFVITAALLGSVERSLSADLKKGLNAHFDQDYATAWQELEPLADKGNPQAQLKIAEMLHLGHGTPQDVVRAYKYYNLAAEQGSGAAMQELATIYEHGFMIPKNPIREMMWLFVTAEMGSTVSARLIEIKRKYNMITRAQDEQAQRLARECLDKKYKEC